MPVQIDGEPHRQPPCEIRISCRGQALVLRRTQDRADGIKTTVDDSLHWATTQGIISEDQREFLLTDILKRLADKERNDLTPF